MILTYEKMKKYLDERYEYREGQTKGFYYNELEEVVATIDEQTITAYYKQKGINDRLPDLYAVSIIKNLYVGKNEDQKVIDAMHIQPLYNNTNDLKVENNFAIEMYENEEISIQKLGAIGLAVKGEKNRRHFINDEIDIEVPKREYQQKDLFTLYGIYLLLLRTTCKTDKIDYSKVKEYYKGTLENLKGLNNSYLIQKHGLKYLETREYQTYDGLIEPTILPTEEEYSKGIREIFVPKINNGNGIKQTNNQLIKKRV